MNEHLGEDNFDATGDPPNSLRFLTAMVCLRDFDRYLFSAD